jgi:hypothetical protein
MKIIEYLRNPPPPLLFPCLEKQGGVADRNLSTPN